MLNFVFVSVTLFTCLCAQHDSKDKSVRVYGYSVGFGQADHELSKRLLEQVVEADWTIETSTEGY